MSLKIIYEDNDILVIDKPAGLVVFSENQKDKIAKTLIDYLLEKYPQLENTGKPPRYGIVHRLDKDTSGIILVAKNNKALFFLQQQFKERKVAKRYLALAAGNIKNDQGTINALIGRSPKDKKKQKVYLAGEPGAKGKRAAVTGYKVIKRFNNYTLLEVTPKTGRKHQIRCHLAYINHPIVGDKMYGFKGQPSPKGLGRHFLHASYLKIQLPTSEEKEFKSELFGDLKKILKQLE